MKAQNGKAGISRDIDPALIQILIPLANDLAEKELPSKIPAAVDLRNIKDKSQREKLLNEAVVDIINETLSIETLKIIAITLVGDKKEAE